MFGVTAPRVSHVGMELVSVFHVKPAPVAPSVFPRILSMKGPWRAWRGMPGQVLVEGAVEVVTFRFAMVTWPLVWLHSESGADKSSLNVSEKIAGGSTFASAKCCRLVRGRRVRRLDNGRSSRE